VSPPPARNGSSLAVQMPRTFDGDGFRRRAALLLFRADSLAVLLVHSSKRGAARWVVPGGGVEPGETPAACAARELLEESGARPAAGAPLAPLGTVCDDGAKRTRTEAFLARAADAPLDDAYLEAGARGRAWTPLGAARAALADSPVGAAIFAAAVGALGLVDADLGDATRCAAAVDALLLRAATARE
jgi:8-oxo-dGTP pyrophosphatase MutT (NUDIX family)